MKEIFSAASVFAILFYVAINLGFNSVEDCKVDASLWIPACIRLNSYLNKSKDQKNDPTTVNNFYSDKSEKGVSLPEPYSGNHFKSIKVIPDSLLNKTDSTKIKSDSLLSENDSLKTKKDTVDVYAQDSTARIQKVVNQI